MKIFAQSPVLWLAICFLSGILLSSFLPASALLYCLSSCLIFFMLKAINKKKPSLRYEWLISILLLISFSTLGFWRAHLKKPDTLLDQWSAKEIRMKGTINGPVKQHAKFQSCLFSIEAIESDSIWHRANANIQLYLSSPTPKDSLQKGGLLVVSGQLKKLQMKNPSYQDYLEKRGVQKVCFANWFISLGPIHYGFWEKLKLTYSQKFQSLIQNPEISAIASAMILGEKSRLEKETRAIFVQTGMAHVLAISGLHVGIVFVLLGYMGMPLHLFPFGQKIKYILIIGLLIAYMLLTGSGPAVVRAVCMFVAVLLCKIFRRRSELLNILGLVALIQMVNAPDIVFEIGFQLSYAAMLGILLLMPILEKMIWETGGLLGRIQALLAVSIAASLATLPFCLIYFQQFPTYFLLANLMTSFLSAICVWVGFLLLISIGMSALGLDVIFSFLTEFAIGALLEVCSQISSWPYAIIQHWQDPGLGIVCLELGLAFMIFQWLSLKSALSKSLFFLWHSIHSRRVPDMLSAEK